MLKSRLQSIKMPRLFLFPKPEIASSRNGDQEKTRGGILTMIRNKIAGLRFGSLKKSRKFENEIEHRIDHFFEIEEKISQQQKYLKKQLMETELFSDLKLEVTINSYDRSRFFSIYPRSLNERHVKHSKKDFQNSTAAQAEK